VYSRNSSEGRKSSIIRYIMLTFASVALQVALGQDFGLLSGILYALSCLCSPERFKAILQD